MNDIEYINATIGFALDEGRIDPIEAAKIRGRLIELIDCDDASDRNIDAVREIYDDVHRRFDDRDPTSLYPSPKFIVTCRDDDHGNVLATHRLFDSKEEANTYADTVARTRMALVVEVLKPLYTAEQEFGEDQ